MCEYSEHVERVLLEHFNKHYTNREIYPWQQDGKATIEETLDRFAHSRESFLAEQLLQPLGKQLIYDNDKDVWVIALIESDEESKKN